MFTFGRNGETLEHVVPDWKDPSISRVTEMQLLLKTGGLATFGKILIVHVWKWSSWTGCTVGHAVSCFGTDKVDSVLTQAVFRLFKQMVTGSYWDQTPELKLLGKNEWKNERTNEFPLGPRNTHDICQSILALGSLRKVSLFVARRTNKQGCFKVFPGTRPSFLPGCGDPVASGGRLAIVCSLSTAENHRQQRYFHKLGVCWSSGSWDLGHTQTRGKNCGLEPVWSAHREK